MAMKVANVAELKNRLGEFLTVVEQGQEVEVRRRNIPIARLVPIHPQAPNLTQLGCGLNTVEIQADLTEPQLPASEWQGLE